MKRCTTCMEIKTQESYSRGKGSYGLHNICKTCDNIRRNALRAANPLRGIWHAMMDRCYKTTDKSYVNYGARGITVCDKWHAYDSYKADIQAMGDKPSPGHSIDRIDNNGPYCPSNVRWAAPQEQSLNKRMYKTNKSGYIGVHWDKKARKWRAQVRRNTKIKYLGHFTTAEEARAARDKWFLENPNIVPT